MIVGRHFEESGMLDTEQISLPSPAELLTWVLDTRVQPITKMFEDLGSASPRRDWDPPREIIESDRLRRLNDHWHALGAGEIPARSSFFPEHVAYILGNLAVIDLDESTGSLGYRLYGTAVSERYGRDLTGTTIDESGETLARFFAAAFRGVLEKRRPLYTRHSPPSTSLVRDCQRLILPFADDQGVLRHLVVGHLPYRPPIGSVARSLGQA
jgi:hypothetical protein